MNTCVQASWNLEEHLDLKADVHFPISAELKDRVQGLQKGSLPKIGEMVGVHFEAQGRIVGVVLQGLHTTNAVKPGLSCHCWMDGHTVHPTFSTALVLYDACVGFLCKLRAGFTIMYISNQVGVASRAGPWDCQYQLPHPGRWPGNPVSLIRATSPT